MFKLTFTLVSLYTNLDSSEFHHCTCRWSHNWWKLYLLRFFFCFVCWLRFYHHWLPCRSTHFLFLPDKPNEKIEGIARFLRYFSSRNLVPCFKSRCLSTRFQIIFVYTILVVKCQGLPSHKLKAIRDHQSVKSLQEILCTNFPILHRYSYEISFIPGDWGPVQIFWGEGTLKNSWELFALYYLPLHF